MDEKIKKQLLWLISDHLDMSDSELADNAPFDAITDALVLIELILAIEEWFGVALPDSIEDTVLNMEQITVGHFIQLVDPYLS